MTSANFSNFSQEKSEASIKMEYRTVQWLSAPALEPVILEILKILFMSFVAWHCLKQSLRVALVPFIRHIYRVLRLLIVANLHSPGQKLFMKEGFKCERTFREDLSLVMTVLWYAYESCQWTRALFWVTPVVSFVLFPNFWRISTEPRYNPPNRPLLMPQIENIVLHHLISGAVLNTTLTYIFFGSLPFLTSFPLPATWILVLGTILKPIIPGMLGFFLYHIFPVVVFDMTVTFYGFYWQISISRIVWYAFVNGFYKSYDVLPNLNPPQAPAQLVP